MTIIRTPDNKPIPHWWLCWVGEVFNGNVPDGLITVHATGTL